MFFQRIVILTVFFFEFSVISFSATQTEIQPGGVLIQNEYYKYKFDTHQGLKLQELFNHYTNDNNIKDPSNLYLGVITLNNERITLDAMNVADVSKTSDGLLTFQLEHPSVQCRLCISYNDAPETLWQLTVKNISGTDAKMKVVFSFTIRFDPWRFSRTNLVPPRFEWSNDRPPTHHSLWRIRLFFSGNGYL